MEISTAPDQPGKTADQHVTGTPDPLLPAKAAWFAWMGVTSDQLRATDDPRFTELGEAMDAAAADDEVGEAP